jgi:hypothetical protein
MSHLHSENFDATGVEALLQAAGGYVGPSDDLRPRVLEEARRLRSGGQRRWRLAFAGGSALAAVTLLSVQASTLSSSLSDATPSQRVAQLVASSDATSKSTGEGLWALVDAFFKVRSEQADAFRPGSQATDAPIGESSEGVAQMPATDGSF